MSDLETFEKLAHKFAEKVKDIDGIEDIALFGSVAGEDPNPKDCDILLVMRHFKNIAFIAKQARKLGSISLHWDIFIITPDKKHVGNISHKKDPWAHSIELNGERIHHVKKTKDFTIDLMKSLIHPIKPLVDANNIIAAWQKEVLSKLRLDLPKPYPVVKSETLACGECGKSFVWKAAEKKYFKRMGYHPPLRCPDCRPAKCSACNEHLWITNKEAQGDELCDTCMEMSEGAEL